MKAGYNVVSSVKNRESPSLVIHAPEYQVIQIFKNTFETGLGSGYAFNNTRLG